MRQFAAEKLIEKLVKKESKRMRDRKQAKSHLAQEEVKAKMEIAGGDHQLKTDEKAQGRSMLITKIRESSKRIVVEKHQYVSTFFY